jgi:serine phosphatase RsbU (regulator of sigma subunit)
MSSAGHLPPVLLVPGEEPDVAGIVVDVPIGVADDHPRTSTVLEVAPGSLVCLYTDGLVERRDRSLDTGIGSLAAALGTVMKEPGPLPLAEEACIAVMRVLVGASAATDDVAVLMMHRPAVT